MFTAKIRSEVLREITDVISTLVDEAKFNLTSDSLTVRAVDPAHVAMVDMVIEKGAFEDYKADEGELGIDLDKVKEVLRLAKAGDVIEVDHDEDRNRLVVHVGNITRQMALVDTAGMSDPKVPNLDLPAKVVVRTDEIRQGIKASESVSDHIALIAHSDGFEMISEGDADTVRLDLPKDLLDELQCKEKVRSLFPLDYFSNMVKAISSASSVTIHLGNDYPVRLEFGLAADNGKAIYLLAPRIESQ